MKKLEYYFFLILLIKIISANNKIYRIKFGLYNEKYSSSDIINNIFYNKLYLNLSIGTSPQIVPFILDNEVQTFCVTNDVYIKNLSSTYEQISDKEINIDYEVVKKGYYLMDILNIDDKVDTKINFILGTEFQGRKQKLGIIGLSIPYLIQDGVFPFLQSLKYSKLISSFSWTLKFFQNISLYDLVTYDNTKDNIIGEFIFGDEPSNYENDSYKYNANGYYKINPLPSKGIRYWKFNFSNIYISLKEGENISKIYYQDEYENNAEIIISFSFISGPQYFLYFIQQHFFYEQYIDGICEDKYFDFYTYYECDSSLKVENFPNITFEQRDFGYSFNLTYVDLFVFDEKSNKYIFLIFTRDNSDIWEFGTVFLRKFQFVFNDDLKTIGFYKDYSGDNDNNGIDHPDKNNSDTKKIILIVVLSLIFAALLIFIGMLIQKKICNRDRKKRANELKDNYVYMSENVDENGLEINSDKKILKDD